MNRPSNFHIALRTLSALALMFALTTTVLPQHEGHVMPKPAAKPKPKAAPKKRRTAPRTRRTPTRRATTPRPSPSPSPHVMTPGMQMPAASPSPSPGHVMTPGMQMPTASPSPSPGHVMTPGMRMPTQPQEIVRPRREVIPASPILRLEDLEAMAVQGNPTLAQAEAAIRAAEGRRRQAGMFPNPIAGYFLEEFAFRSPGETMEHGAFIEQTIPLGGKLSKARRVFAREKDQVIILAEAQRLRVTNSIRVLYYETLGAQRLVELRDDLSQLAREAVEITKELSNVGQADRPDQLEIEIEAERSEIDFLRAQNDWLRSWRTLAAMVGDPQLVPARLADSPEEDLASLNEAQLQETLLSQSPDIRVAQAGVERARAVLARARAERVPDLFLRGGLGYNYERFEPVVPSIAGRRKGAEGRLEVGVTVPIFNRNQGGIAAAEAELEIAERDLQRLQLVLRSRFASSFREYRNAQQMVERYRTQVVPRARQGYQMYLSSFRQMAAAYPQVLIAQRTLFQVEVEYARALIQLRQSAVGLRGFLLEGGLDPLTRPGERTEGFKLRAPNEATGDSDIR
ncbi:MAG TPA: TolC family protein [Pyrinomonadaceae bacterium]|nr:TolC family protein [Pyrinomonadaceae bacterium]